MNKQSLDSVIKSVLKEVAVSKSQKRFYCFVKSCKESKYKDCGSGTDIVDAAKSTSMTEINKYCSTSESGLPEKVSSNEQELEEKYWWLNNWRRRGRWYR